MKVEIYVEGGGDTRALQKICREGFSKLIRKADLSGQMPKIIACGDRGRAYKDFKTALRQGDVYPVLLVDSESLMTSDAANGWQQLQSCDGWSRPPNTSDRQAQLMVTCMETWIIADRSTLAVFFGQGFVANALPSLTNLENCPKSDIISGLENATRRCRRQYKESQKRVISFKILGELEPSTLKQHLPHFNEFIDFLGTLLNLSD